MTTANSSPPRRATRSSSRSTPWMRCATISSSRSPTWWPRVSLTSLKRSRSSSATEKRVQVRTLDGLGQPLQQELAVGQPGQRVVQGLVLLDQRHPRRLVHGEHRDQQQRDEPRAAHRREHDERREREHGGGRDDVVDDVLGERLPERLPDVGRDARHEHVVHDEPDHPRRDDPQQVGAVERATGRDQAVREAGHHHRDERRAGGQHVLPHVEEELPRRLVLDHLGGDGDAGLQQQRGPQPPHVHDREDEGCRGDGPLGVPCARRTHRAQLAEQDERRDHPERRGHHAHLGLDLDGGDHDERPPAPHRDVPGQREQRPVGQ